MTSTYNLGQIINNIFVQDNRQRPYGGRNKRTDCKRPAYVEVTPTRALLFITILIKMTSNKNENGLPVKAAGQTALVHETDKSITMVELSKVLNHEYFEFTKQLAVMNNWFYQLGDSGIDEDGYLEQYTGKVCDCIRQVVDGIAELVMFDFKENVFYNPPKQSV